MTDSSRSWVAAFSDAAPTYDTVIPFFAYWGVVLARHARLRPTDRVVDVGCGPGASLVPASHVSGFAVGVDASIDMLEHVAWPVSLCAADGAALPLADGAADVVLCGFTIQFFADAEAGVREFARVLAPGGRVVISLPDAEIPACAAVKRSWGERLALAPPSQSAEGWLEAALASAGFARVEVTADTHTFTFASGDDYLAWNWSHGARALLTAVPEAERGRFEAELVAAAESARIDGAIPLHTSARFWVGHRDL